MWQTSLSTDGPAGVYHGSPYFVETAAFQGPALPAILHVSDFQSGQERVISHYQHRLDRCRFTGLSWLFMGAANSDARLYDDEIQSLVKAYPDQFRVDYALSRETKNKKVLADPSPLACGAVPHHCRASLPLRSGAGVSPSQGAAQLMRLWALPPGSM